jgi:hypothetical protein
MASACSRTILVEKGQTGALFLLSEIGEEAFSIGLPDMKRKEEERNSKTHKSLNRCLFRVYDAAEIR